jgi:adenosine deaminase
MPGTKMLPSDDLVRLPKAEIHLHLEGCLETDDLVRWAQEMGAPLPRPRNRLTEFEGLASFLDYLDWACGLIRTPELVARQAYALARRLRGEGTLYADVIFNPTHWAAWRTRLPAMIDALDAGFREAEADGFAHVGLCVSLLRQQTSDEAIELVALLLDTAHPRVVALSVDGNEAKSGRTGSRFASAFARAKHGGLRRTVHAGESSGPEGVWDAVRLLHADRIDHGVRAVEDASLLAYLTDHQVPLGICPSSNLTLGLYPSMADHPIDILRQAGIPVSINTDDPVPLNTTLPTEYERCMHCFDWDASVVSHLARTSILASFASETLKADMLARLDAWHPAAVAPDSEPSGR